MYGTQRAVEILEAMQQDEGMQQACTPLLQALSKASLQESKDKVRDHVYLCSDRRCLQCHKTYPACDADKLCMGNCRARKSMHQSAL
eukprot:scaffold222975_cov43-Prasinocladus_malaysianus.AAC.1